VKEHSRIHKVSRLNRKLLRTGFEMYVSMSEADITSAQGELARCVLFGGIYALLKQVSFGIVSTELTFPDSCAAFGPLCCQSWCQTSGITSTLLPAFWSSPCPNSSRISYHRLLSTTALCVCLSPRKPPNINGA